MRAQSRLLVLALLACVVPRCDGDETPAWVNAGLARAKENGRVAVEAKATASVCRAYLARDEDEWGNVKLGEATINGSLTCQAYAHNKSKCCDPTSGATRPAAAMAVARACGLLGALYAMWL